MEIDLDYLQTGTASVVARNFNWWGAHLPSLPPFLPFVSYFPAPPLATPLLSAIYVKNLPVYNCV